MTAVRAPATLARVALAAVAAASLATPQVTAQSVTADRERAHEILRDIEKELRKRYYDPAFRGMDVDAVFARAGERVDSATAEGQISGILVQALLDLDDSHTFFIPPPLSFEVDYGFELGIVGDRCYIVAVDPGSDAEGQGLRPGTAVLYVEGATPGRENLWQIRYALDVARPRRELRIGTVAPDGTPGNRVVKARTTPPRRFQDVEDWIVAQGEKGRRSGLPAHVAALGETVAALKLDRFDAEEKVIDEALESVRGKDGLVLDLRDNPGGAVDALERLVGGLFDREVRIGEERGRKETRPLVARRAPASRTFGGKVVVLVNAASASASEVAARVVQLERRGAVIGDRTAGAVMLSRRRGYTQGHRYRFLFYGLNITEADLVMSDGRSLEKEGVVPDEQVLPTAEDMAAGRDPVLTLAAQRLGVTIDATAAGKLFLRRPR